MDTNKLYNLLAEIEDEYKNHQISVILNSLKRNHIKNQKNKEANRNYNMGIITYEELNTIIKSKNNKPLEIYSYYERFQALERLAENKRIEDLGLTYSKALNVIGGNDYFGNGLAARLKKIRQNYQYNIPELERQLNSLLVARLFFLRKCLATKNDLEKLNIEPVYQDNDKFELGIHIPSNSKFAELKELEKFFKNWNFLLKILNELTNNDHSNPKISSVANGSIEFFIENAFEVSFAVGYIVERLVKIYMNIDKIRKHRKELEKLGIPKSESELIKKQEKEIIKKGYEQTKDDLIEKYKKNLDEGRVNEMDKALMSGITFVAKTIDNGIVVEIIPPYITTPKNKQMNGESNKSTKERKNDARVGIIKETNNLIKNITGAGSDIFKLMAGDENNDNSEEE